MASPPAPAESPQNSLSLTIPSNPVPLSATTLSHSRRASEVISIKRRKASMISTTSTHSAHPLRQTSFPPESAEFTPGYERSPSLDNVSLVSGSVAGGPSKRKRVRKSKSGKSDFEGSNVGGPVKSEGPASKKRRTSTGNIEEDEEEDNNVDQTMTSMTSSIEEKQREIQRRALLANHLDPEQFERYTAMRAVKFPDATIRRIVNQTLSQSVPGTVILAVKSVAKQFVGELIEGARKVQTQWIEAGEPNSGLVHPGVEVTATANGEENGGEVKATKELRRAPLQADHLREALRRLRLGNEDGLAGQLNLWQLQQRSGVERFASRVGGKRLFK
ncbi:hypothetical protein DSL72_000686 [Monilinia vaccinii-corymbosi]|uniref:TAFII28-like protein domain-containing protein n=1 Tax=Monilinia vaccinii-corymbosi TaxID=61207 RepID=A0A8A3P013_9HELO|nr:hypothetical protein DSL72_000686 [Monilinia vaccinii-corymbosi]